MSELTDRKQALQEQLDAVNHSLDVARQENQEKLGGLQAQKQALVAGVQEINDFLAWKKTQ